MKLKTLVFTSLIAVGLSGCASPARDIQSSYVSPNEYSGMTCDQMRDEMRGISSRVGLLGGQLDEEADADKWQMGVGLVLFWPALFFLEGGDGAQAAEYAQLKGKYEAVDTQYRRANCESGNVANSAI